ETTVVLSPAARTTSEAEAEIWVHVLESKVKTVSVVLLGPSVPGDGGGGGGGGGGDAYVSVVSVPAGGLLPGRRKVVVSSAEARMTREGSEEICVQRWALRVKTVRMVVTGEDCVPGSVVGCSRLDWGSCWLAGAGDVGAFGEGLVWGGGARRGSAGTAVLVVRAPSLEAVVE
ncbi:hypothetical protein Tdes44962_MAKER08023, partial [Teratosphaeria destructans]